MKYLLALFLCILAACSAQTPGLSHVGKMRPQGAGENTCWDKIETPAIVQSVTENVLIAPAKISESGTIQAPPLYRQRHKQIIVKERGEQWIQILCAHDLTPEFVASLQRAFIARNYMQSAVTARLDAPTIKAIARYQAEQNIPAKDPKTLTIEAARALGLWVVELDT
jgi:hypothetical protein